MPTRTAVSASDLAADVPAPVGIVVAAFDAAPFIGATLESIRHQTFRGWVCIVVDDGSSDDTGAIARHFAADDDRFRVIGTENHGHCVARNTGIDAHGADIDAIIVMDADDIWLPGTLALLVERLAARPDCIGAHGLGEFIDQTGERIEVGAFAAFGRARRSGRSGCLRDWPRDRDTMFETLVTASTVFPPGLVLMRRSTYTAIGGYYAPSVEGDWDLLIRAARHGPLAFVDEVIIYYRRHTQNFGARSEMRRLTHLTLLRAHESKLNSPEQAATLRACWRASQLDAMKRHRAALASADGPWAIAAALLRIALASARYVRGRPGRPLHA